ncbi:sialate O-acetylesterase [Clostridium sp. BSD9I1]|uniref:sialate O-acetylesterase n=1 Tax=Clostridium sp. BSD9I1 TaxID=2003589 RepID=UPI001645B2E1|nr:sialate O-acetylesterase [Clostridium sp. BSD9I1]
MAIIASIVQAIRSVTFGKDMRENIARGIETINTEVESTTAKQSLLETVFEQLIIDKGNSNAEIVQARVDADGKAYVNLKERMDTVDSHLAENVPLLAQTLSSEEIDIFLVYGQSNAMGYAGNSVGDPTYKTPNVTVWDGTKEIPLTNYMPTSQGEISTGGAWVAFANEYARQTGRKAILANCAKGSQSIASLSKGSTNALYSKLVEWTNAIKTHITDKNKIVGKVAILWCQGEADAIAQTTRASYETSISALWTNIKADIGANSFNIFTVGFYNDNTKKYGWQIQNAQRNFSKANTDVFIVFDNIDSLAGNNMKVDGVHLNQYGYNFMGEIGAKNYCETVLLKPSNEALPLLSRSGRINLDGTQEWHLFGGWIRKLDGVWEVSSQTARAITGIQSASEVSGGLRITLAEKINYILYEDAKISYGLSEIENNQVIKAKVIPVTYETENNSNTEAIIHFYADVVVDIDLDSQTLNTNRMGYDFSNLFTATFATGGVTLTHPKYRGGSCANVHTTDNTPRLISLNNSSNDSTNVRTFNTTGTLVNSKISIVFKDMRIPVENLPSTLNTTSTAKPELMFYVIGAKKQNS